jgi:hypothetical protein
VVAISAGLSFESAKSSSSPLEDSLSLDDDDADDDTDFSSDPLVFWFSLSSDSSLLFSSSSDSSPFVVTRLESTCRFL